MPGSRHKRTLVLGASLNPHRYSNAAVQMLRQYGHPVHAIGLRAGEIGDVSIVKGMPDLSSVHTVTLYLNKKNQKPYLDYIFGLKPKRIIFNPGTENPELSILAKQRGVEAVHGCTLYLLSTSRY